MSLDPSPLEEERDLLLRSLDDLEREFEAGDLDRDDYETLRDDYTHRAATVIRRIEGGAGRPSARPSASATLDSGAEAESAGSEAASATLDSGAEVESAGPQVAGGGRSGSGRRVGVVVVLLAFAVVAGLMLARTAGERGVNDQITGAIDESARTKVVRCQELGSTGGDLLGALECFDEILAEDPSNAEALTYRGWYLLLASGSLQDGGTDADENAVELMARGLDYLNRAIEADPSFPDPLAFRASVNDRLGQSTAACADIAALQALDPPEFFLTQTASIAERNGC